MTVKTFFIGLIASFALPWLAVVAVPYATMRAVEIPQFDAAKDGKEGAYTPVKSGRVTNGSLIYGAEGCAQCHSQLARPTYAGNDLGRPDLAGIAKDPDLGDTRRESNLWDYAGEPFAWIGETRMGPDLGNFGRRMEILANAKNKARAEELGIKDILNLPVAERFNMEAAVNLHLYDPRIGNVKSICPSNKCFFNTDPVYGQGAVNALPIESKDGKQVIPGERVQTLTSYLLGLKRDGEVPNSINYARNKKSSK
jgi:cytochrome c oxidase cbb3-type subunit 2